MWKGNGNLLCKSMELFFEVYDNKEFTQVEQFKYSNNLNIKPYKEDFMYILIAYYMIDNSSGIIYTFHVSG